MNRQQRASDAAERSNPPPPPPVQSQSQEQSALRSQFASGGLASNGLNGHNSNSYLINGGGGLGNISSLGNSAGSTFGHQVQNSGGNMAAGGAAGQSANGIMGNRAQWPSTGDQMDMQVLWELINNIAEVQQGIREQTSGVLQRVHSIQAARADEASLDSSIQNGTATTTDQAASTAASSLTGAKEQAYLDEISSLRSQLSSTTTQFNSLTLQHQTLATLLQHHESSLGMVLTRLRPYATQHTQALETQKAHYLSLLEQERSQNLDLRLEMSRLQDGLGKVLAMVRAAEREDVGKERKWTRRIAGVRAENRVLKGVCGLPVEAESSESDSEDEEEEWIANLERASADAATAAAAMTAAGFGSSSGGVGPGAGRHVVTSTESAAGSGGDGSIPGPGVKRL